MTAARTVELIDSCILIDLLDIPYESEELEVRKAELQERHRAGVQMLIPVAVVIEVGQHVQRIGQGYDRRRCADAYVAILRKTLAGNAPWHFTSVAWNADFLTTLIELPHWPEGNLVESLAVKHHEMGDAAIIAELMSLRANLRDVKVGVWTRDAKLRATVEALR